MHKTHLGFLYGLLAALTSAGTAVFTKLATDVPTPVIVFIRFFICFVLLIPICKGKLQFSWGSFPKHFTRGIIGLGSMYCYFYSVKHLPLVNATTLTNTAPLFMPLVVLLWAKLVVSKRRFWAGALGFLGILIMLRPSPDHFSGWASGAGIATGALSAIAFFTIRQLSKTATTETILFHYFGVSIVLSTVPMILSWHTAFSRTTWIYLITMGILSAIYQFAITKSFTHAPASQVSTMVYIGIFFSGLAGWWMFDEVPSLWIFVGAAFTILGGILALLDKTPPRPLKP